MLMKDKVVVQFDSHILQKKGTNQFLFYTKVCRRFGNVRLLDIVAEFNNNRQNGGLKPKLKPQVGLPNPTSSMDAYQLA